MNSALPSRDGSLDAFRGLDVLLMIIVNVQGSDDVAFTLLKHVEWTGMTFADLVFPIFLLITGLSAPLALDRVGAVISWPAILKRAFLLFMIGVLLSWLIKPTFDPDLIRWTGVLQRIAIVYLACAAVIIVRRGIGLSIALAVLLMAFETWMLLRVGAPNGAGPSMEPGMGISGWLDQNFIPGRVLRKTWEPEGILSTLPAIANGLIGVATMRWVQQRGVGATGLAALGGMLIVVGMTATLIVPLNKNLWTASFTLVTSGIGISIWALLKAVWLRIGDRPFLARTAGLGRAALTLYVVHTLLIAIIVRKLPDGQKIWKVTYEMLASTGLNPALASLLYSLIALGLSVAVMPFLHRRGWILKV
jgi:predicted acyltransferase